MTISYVKIIVEMKDAYSNLSWLAYVNKSLLLLGNNVSFFPLSLCFSSL